ncbi:MAG: TIGR03905 family TSCPD domain-containing protein [Deltaproteobacteria bacterium]|nr:TIGR03905 family TSCPD domain-containing protein [Deltaproteobacteria bacterium]
MKPKNELRRFIFHTCGVCPPEIHFQLNHSVLEEVRFVGGGCPGNAQLVSRLIKGRTVDHLLPLLDGIECREQTSCADQLADALQSALNGTLLPADTVRIMDDQVPRERVGLLGDLNGNPNVLEKIISGMQTRNIETAYCVGNFTGKIQEKQDIIHLLRREKKVVFLLGERDWSYADYHGSGLSSLTPRDRDWVAMLPQVLTFQLENRKAVAFYGNYLQNLQGFSDYAPYALEINMVCGLTDFMRDEAVFPALEAMIPQFQADLILFGQRQDWGHWCMGGKDFLSVGRSEENGNAKWGILDTVSYGIRMEIIEEPI